MDARAPLPILIEFSEGIREQSALLRSHGRIPVPTHQNSHHAHMHIARKYFFWLVWLDVHRLS